MTTWIQEAVDPANYMFVLPPSLPLESTDVSNAKPGAKVTQRMLQLRELIAQGEYPDKDELAERIVDKL